MTVTTRNAGDLLTAAIFNTKLEAPIATAEIGSGAITAPLIADGSVTAAKLASQPAARVYHSVNQSIANATYTALAFNSERFDTDAMHDPTTNNSRLTAKTAGKYLVLGHFAYSANSTGFRFAALRVNGGSYYAEITYSAQAGTQTEVLVVTLLDLALNDYVELIAYQSSGGSLNVETIGNTSPEFSLVRVGP